MRVTIACSACSLLVLVACGGGSPKPAATEADTSSLESSGAPSTAAPASTAATDSSPAAAPDRPAAASTASAASTAAPAAAAAVHPVPGTTGEIDGKAFSPKLAQLVGAVQKDGRATVLIHGGTDCMSPDDAKSGDGSILLVVPWKDGYKTDLSALRRAKGGNLGEAAFVRKKQASPTFKPSGLVTVVSAPTEKGKVGKMKIDLTSGGYILTGDLDVMVCGS